MDIKVSVIIPTKNAGAEFRKTLEGIFSQKVSLPFEVIVIDSGSTDETLTLCKEFNIQPIQIAPEEFNHGETRNYAIGRSKGDFIAFLVQDAIPYNEDWLEVLIRKLAEDPKVAGVCSRHIPKENSSALIRFLVDLWNKDLDLKERKEQEITDPEKFDELPLEERRRFAYFSNVSSAIRREAWEKFPFHPLPYAEDLEWSLRVLKAGYKIVYDPASIVYHSHDRSIWYEFNRAILEGKVFSEIFNSIPKDEVSPMQLLSLLEKILKEIKIEDSILNTPPSQGWDKGGENLREKNVPPIDRRDFLTPQKGFSEERNLNFEYVTELNIYYFFRKNFNFDTLKFLLGNESYLKHHEKEWLLEVIERKLHNLIESCCSSLHKVEFIDIMKRDLLSHFYDIIWFDISKDLIIWASAEAHKDDMVFMLLKDILFFTEFVVKNIKDMDWGSYRHMRLYVAATILGKQLGLHGKGKIRPLMSI